MQRNTGGLRKRKRQIKDEAEIKSGKEDAEKLWKELFKKP
jgi:hypothetical protein